jgi:hypothetical protein
MSFDLWWAEWTVNLGAASIMHVTADLPQAESACHQQSSLTQAVPISGTTHFASTMLKCHTWHGLKLGFCCTVQSAACMSGVLVRNQFKTVRRRSLQQSLFG